MIIILILLCILFFFPVTVLFIQSDNEISYKFYTHNFNEFSIRWIHSVELEEWEEFFEIEGTSIMLNSTRFKTFGAGVPSNAGTHSYLKDGWVYMIDINRQIGDELVIQTGNETHHRVYFKDSILELNKVDTAYHIKVEQLKLIDMMSGYIKKIDFQIIP
ncbi:DUF1850 domain-containing protein [Chengkuizengella marina]|uniref:DUF1850 domain-containing protein n=1 Tax=Chengkuizengella marina TaxID=2507566 RepID=A0A6N9Q7D0_9BACL|nr:DUF1850 domain-containing protein [Chengkuizengella marina]NBI30709.1 DUF1850 domain-containing protein [Chengkuizengella marina]